MKKSHAITLGSAGLMGLAGLFLIGDSLIAQGPPGAASDEIDLTIRQSYDVPPSDPRAQSITESAQAFAATLSASQRESLIFPFTDNVQRANWSNLPEGVVQRRGIRLGELTPEQRTALNALLGEVLSEDGTRNVALQLAADDTLITNAQGRPNFGSDYYFVSFIGEPSTASPWMLQFGGHHLAINATFFGGEASYSPMLTGGQPLHLRFEGDDVFIPEQELTAARDFLDSLSDQQRGAAIRGNRAINLLLGPGRYGTVVAPEGISGASLMPNQRTMLLEVVSARLGFINSDDYESVMTTVEAELDRTYFAWWGPLEPLGAAYFRVTAPSLVLEYAPQSGFGGGDGTDHAHSMYRNPQNDYGLAWLGARP